MDDDLIFLLCVNIMGFIVMDVIGMHLLAIDAVWAVVNTVLTMYFYRKHNKGKK